MLALANVLALTAGLALGVAPREPHREAAEPPPAATAATTSVEFLVDAAAATQFFAAIQATESSSPGLRAALRLYGAAGPADGKDTGAGAAAADCAASVLAVPFTTSDLALWATAFAPPPAASGNASLARALEAAAKDLAAEKTRSKLLIVIAGSPGDCGGDACAAAMKLAHSGLRQPRVIAVSADGALTERVACIGSTEPAATPEAMGVAIARALDDAVGKTGIEVTVYEGAGKPVPERVAAVPIAADRRDVVSSLNRGDHYALAHGTYRVSVEDAEGMSETVRVTEGEVARVAFGKGSLLVRALSFWGGPLSTGVEVMPAGTSQPAAAAKPAKTSHQGVPHSTLPMVGDGSSTQPSSSAQPSSSTQPAATQPSSATTQPAATQPASANDAAPPPAPVTAVKGTTGNPIDLPAGRYDVVVHAPGGVLRTRQVRIEPGERAEVVVRLGGLRVDGDGPFAILDESGRTVAQTRTRQVVSLVPGNYWISQRGIPRNDSVKIDAGLVAVVDFD